MSKWGLCWQGYRATTPLMVGVAPFGFVFGAIATGNGMSGAEAVGMSIIVLAGSSQFIAAQLLGDHTPALIIILTTFVVNLRHFLYSASLASFVRPLSKGWRALLAYMMVDEVYAIVITRHLKRDLTASELAWFFVGSGFCLISLWWTSTFVGVMIGNILPANTVDLLSFTLPLIFTAIVIPALKTRPMLFAALSAGITGIICAPMPNKLGLLVAAAVGIAAGLWSESQIAPTPSQEAA
ncbi:MAG: AzlC family ABC transporter permease [Chloroflexi bacterium]|nr:AzlC family ABC transporter permease [Chloroflexota bacterium]